MTSPEVVERDATIAPSARERFARDVVEAFERAGIEFVLLHGHDARARDSDLDVAVTRGSLRAVDALVMAGTFGPMLQRLWYDVPWCVYYVVESDEPGRRYRQLDVACDPWGIGRYGPALPIALDFIARNPRARALDPVTETAYLAVKRAQKGVRHDSERSRLEHADPSVLGAAGELLAARLGPTSGLALDSVADRVQRYRRTPARRLLRAVFQLARVVHRVRRPTGLVVSLAGPDGSGKSTLAHALEGNSTGLFRQVERRHLGPGLLPPPARLLGRRPSDGTAPHARPPSGRLGAGMRLAYLWADGLLGWVPRMAMPRIRSTLVLLERNWLDLAVDPRRYRLPARARAVRLLGRLLPRPDLALLLDADACAVASRKNELDADETERQLREWRALLPRAGRSAALLKASAPPRNVVSDALSAIHEQLRGRHPDVASASLPIGIAGSVSRAGQTMGLVEIDGRPRWLIPRRRGGRGPLRAGLYRPARRWQLPAAVALEAMAAAGRLGTALPLDLEQGLLPVLRTALQRPDLEVGAVGLPRDRQERVLVTLVSGGRLAGFAKVSADAEPLQHEARVLDLLGRVRPTAFTVPHPLALLEWEGLTVLILEPIRPRGRALRPFGPHEQAVLEELPRLAEALAPVLGSDPELVPVHGDFTPWNTASMRGSRFVVWDWEDARLGLPLEDLFHWRTQLLVLFGVGSIEELVVGAYSPDLAAVAARLGLTPDGAPRALHAYLRRRALDGKVHPATREVADRALELMDGTHQ